ncbi:MAG: Omp28-related outer membrane protein [Flavobacteriales bacterium]
MKTTTINLGKYLLLSFLAIGMTLSSCKKEDEKEDETPSGPTFTHQMKKIPYIYKHTGETCYYCGDWGWPLWIGAADDNVGNALAWGNYGTGFSDGTFRGQELSTSFSTNEDFQNNSAAMGGKPSFVMNGNKITLTGATIQDAINGITADVAAINADSDIDATAAFVTSWEGDKLKVETQAKLHKQLIGNYFMSAYVIENKAKGPQSGPNGGASVEHHYVMRGSMHTDTWGQELFNGTEEADAVFEKTFEATIPSTYVKENISVGVIIWRKNGTKYFWVNCATDQ